MGRPGGLASATDGFVVARPRAPSCEPRASWAASIAQCQPVRVDSVARHGEQRAARASRSGLGDGRAASRCRCRSARRRGSLALLSLVFDRSRSGEVVSTALAPTARGSTAPGSTELSLARSMVVALRLFIRAASAHGGRIAIACERRHAEPRESCKGTFFGSPRHVERKSAYFLVLFFASFSSPFASFFASSFLSPNVSSSAAAGGGLKSSCQASVKSDSRNGGTITLR
jgi:hypothetical protein